MRPTGGPPCTALLSRQFRPLPRSRVEGLLAAFPKLIPEGSQHTTVENADVRFVYQAFEEAYVLLITNKGSNILQVSSGDGHERSGDGGGVLHGAGNA